MLPPYNAKTASDAIFNPRGGEIVFVPHNV